MWALNDPDRKECWGVFNQNEYARYDGDVVREARAEPWNGKNARGEEETVIKILVYLR